MQNAAGAGKPWPVAPPACPTAAIIAKQAHSFGRNFMTAFRAVDCPKSYARVPMRPSAAATGEFAT